jgi:type VI secretion system secreted protein VgrG
MGTLRPVLEFECGEDSLAVRRVTVHERLDGLFTVDVLARSPDHDIDMSAIIGKGAALGALAEAGILAWSGVCNHIEQTKPADFTEGRSTYTLRIVPSLWLLTQRRGHRIFQHQTVKDIVTKVLDEYSIEASWELTEEHPTYEYRVQYDETDFDFVSRLLQEAGIAYLFEPTMSKSGAKSKLIFKDGPQQGGSIGTIEYYQAPNEGHITGLFVTDVRVSHHVRPGKVTYRDYTFRKPSLALIDSSEFPLQKDEKLEEKYEQYHYFPNVSRHDKSGASEVLPVADDKSTARHENKENKRRADVGAEAARWGKRLVEFRSNHPALRAGALFEIENHPRDQLAKKLMLVEAHILITELDWNVLGTAVFADVPYRPRIDTPRPTIRGVQTAMVVGPPGQEIYTDEFGRVRVRFHWDREGKFDDEATCWLRVSQAWAGNRFGTMFVPRVGQEVIVQFSEGDPDQPVVIGRLFNETTKVPRKLPDHKTQSIFRTATTPQTDGKFHEIMFDDAAGKELYFFQSERDLLRLTKRNDTERTGDDRTIVVGDGHVNAVAHSDSLQVGEQHLIKMVEAGDLKIPDMGDPQVTELKTWIEMKDEKITLTTGDCTVELNGGDITVDAKGGIRFTSDGKMILKGSMVYLNAGSAGAAAPSAKKKVKDAVAKPDRMIGAIEELFWKPYEDMLARQEKTVDLSEEDEPLAVPTPEQSRKMDEMYALAEDAKDEVDARADIIADELGGDVAKAPLKGRARVVQKANGDYDGDDKVNGDVGQVTDYARNTIVVKAGDEEKALARLRELNPRIGNDQVKKVVASDDPCGYSGMNIKQPAANGMIAETQINTPEMIFAKEAEKDAKAILGKDTYNRLKNTPGMPEGGLGHKYYEDYRKLDPSDPKAEAIALKSQQYYNDVRRLAGGG